MKKIFIFVTFLLISVFSVCAEEEKKEGWSDLTFVNVPVLKILESKDAYTVIYQKQHNGYGKTVIPKAWNKGTVENPKKLKFRKKEPGLLSPFMTVIKKNGEFHRVVLTLPVSKLDSVWGVSKSAQEPEGADKETLEDLAL